MVRESFLVPALFMIACGSAPEEDVFTTDVRIDMAPSDNDPDSGGTRMCVSDGGNIFVVWVDDRDGVSAIWFNRSLDRGASWLPSAVKVNHGEGAAENPDIACTDEGVYVVWEDDRDGALENHQIYFNSSRDAGSSWTEEDTLLEDDEDGVTMSLGPRIVSVGSDLYVAWFDSAFGAYDIFVASSGNRGGEWREPVRVDSDATGEAHSAWPQLAATEFGDVFVAWEDARNGSTDVFFARSENNGTSFLDNVRLDSGDEAGSNYSFNPRMGLDGDNIYVVWHDDRNGEGRDIYLNYSANRGRDWLVEAQRLDGESEGFFNSLFADLVVVGPVAHVAYQDNRAQGYDVFYRKVISGLPDGEEERLDKSDGQGFSNSVNPKLAYGSSTVAVVWEDARAEAGFGTDNGYNDLYYNFTTDGGGSWSDSDLRVDWMAPGESFKIDVNVEVNGGDVMVSWTDGRNGTADIYFQRHALGNQAEYKDPEEGGGGGSDQ